MTKLRSLIRNCIEAAPAGRNIMSAIDRHRLKRQTEMRLARLGDREAVFTHHFQNNEWRNDESVSGSGSTLKYTEKIRKALPDLVKSINASVFLDAPCGDFNWFRFVELPEGVRYIGADIVDALIEQNIKNYTSQVHSFTKIDIVEQPLPAASIWMCRDCLIHLSNSDVFAVLKNFINSQCDYLLTTTHSDCRENTDILTGSFREINLEIGPFSLGEPITKIDDWVDGFPVRHLALWRREDIRARLDKNDSFLASHIARAAPLI